MEYSRRTRNSQYVMNKTSEEIFMSRRTLHSQIDKLDVYVTQIYNRIGITGTKCSLSKLSIELNGDFRVMTILLNNKILTEIGTSTYKWTGLRPDRALSEWIFKTLSERNKAQYQKQVQQKQQNELVCFDSQDSVNTLQHQEPTRSAQPATSMAAQPERQTSYWSEPVGTWRTGY